MSTITNIVCQHCGREIVQDGGMWIDPVATGDDSIWAEVCDSHDTISADHEPRSEITSRVANGIELLTAHGYNLAEIDLESLDLKLEQYCVLGQLFGDYDLGLDALDLSPFDAVAYGFFIQSDDLYWSILTDEWRTQLTALRTVESAS